MATQFVNHHTHSHFSTLDGMPSPQEIVQRAAELGQPSVSLTDHGSMSGIPQAYVAAKEAGIGFTPGIEAYFAPTMTHKGTDRYQEPYYHLILLAENNTGYHNLVKMQTPSWEEGFYRKPRVDYDLLDKYHEGVICTTGCLGSFINQRLAHGDDKTAKEAVQNLIDIFGSDYVYMEIQKHGLSMSDMRVTEEALIKKQVKLAEELHLPLLATCDSHYCHPYDADTHDSLLCTSVIKQKTDTNRFSFEGESFYMHSAEEMLELFPKKDYPGAISNTVELAERTSFSLPYGNREYIMPDLSTGKKTQEELLKEEVYQGAKSLSRYGSPDGLSDDVVGRIEHELQVINQMNFAGYFLLVKKIVELLADHGIHVGPGRGSAPGSIVVYCLGITNIDPLKHGLYFERFLNPDRVSMPDIDIDVPQTRRKESLKLIEEEFGHGHVAHLSTYGSMASKATVIRMGKVFGLNPSQAQKFSNLIHQHAEEHQKTLSDLAEEPIPQDIRKKLPFISPDQYENILSTSDKLIGTVISYGVHASGIVITDSPVDDYFPLRRDPRSDIPICQYDGEDVEALGGVKMDLLGLINLDECETAEKNIALDLGEKVDSSNLVPDDENIFSMLAEGRGGGVFQLGCVSGDTVVDGMEIRHMFSEQKHPVGKITHIRSVFLGDGSVKLNKIGVVAQSGKKPVTKVTIKLNDHGAYREVKATGDHKIFTFTGWKKICDLDIGDQVLSVADYTGYDVNRIQRTRNHDDIIDLYLKHHPEYYRPETSFPVTVGEKTFYPTAINKNDSRDMVLIVKDHAVSPAQEVKDVVDGERVLNGILGDETGIKLTVFHASKIAEDYQFDEEYSKDYLLLPSGCLWGEVTSLDDHGIEETYDIMMDSPVHNFIGNGLMLHNSSGIQSLSKLMHPERQEDISALLALYRPGPMGMDLHTQYCEVKNNPNKIADVPHEDMLEIMSDTHGITCYQEQIMSMAKHFADYTGAQADDLRKAVAKKIPEKMAAQKELFIPRVNNNYGGNLGQKLWDIIEPFGAYAFNKCVSGDTEVLISDHDGHLGRIEASYLPEMLDQCQGQVYTYCVDQTGWSKEAKPTLIKDVHQNGVQDLYRVTLDNGEYIDTTITHRFLTLFGYRTLRDIMSQNSGYGQVVTINPENCEVGRNTIVSICYTGRGETFDVEVEGDPHNWATANGFITHNSHSVAYASTTYRTAWLKYYYPAQFAAAVIDHMISNTDEVAHTIAWAKTEGIDIQSPDINISEKRTTTTKDSLTLPLSIVSGLGDKQAEKILVERDRGGEFTSVVDFQSRVKMPESMLVSLAKAGVFDGFGAGRAQIIQKAPQIHHQAEIHSRTLSVSDGLFADLIDHKEEEVDLELDQEQEMMIIDGKPVRVDTDLYGIWERDILGVLISGHPFDTLKSLSSAQSILSTYKPVDDISPGTHSGRFSGLLTDISTKTSRRGNPYTRFVLETAMTRIPGIMFNKHLDKEKVSGSIVLVTCDIEDEGQDEGSFSPHLLVRDMLKLDVEKLKDKG